jgi:hypothetical protein
MQPFRAAGCVGKQPLNERLARDIAQRMRKGRREHAPVQAYRCDFCGQWHVGSTSRR